MLLKLRINGSFFNREKLLFYNFVCFYRKLSFFYYPQPIGKMKVISLFSLSLIGLMAMVSGLSAKHHEGDDLRDFGTKLKQAVEEGKLSKEDAIAKWKAAAQKKKKSTTGRAGMTIPNQK